MTDSKYSLKQLQDLLTEWGINAYALGRPSVEDYTKKLKMHLTREVLDMRSSPQIQSAMIQPLDELLEMAHRHRDFDPNANLPWNLAHMYEHGIFGTKKYILDTYEGGQMPSQVPKARKPALKKPRKSTAKKPLAKKAREFYTYE